MKKELTIDAVIDNLDQVLTFVESQLEEKGCSVKILTQVQIAVEEIFVNIAHYAYHTETGKATIQLHVEDNPSRICITFIDHGIPYDPLAKADPNTALSAEERQIGGLGIFMVKKTMDNVEYHYQDGNNILTIRKEL